MKEAMISFNIPVQRNASRGVIRESYVRRIKAFRFARAPFEEPFRVRFSLSRMEGAFTSSHLHLSARPAARER